MTLQELATAPAPDRATNDGRHDFDFLFGEWRIANRKLADPLADEPTEWVEFPATSLAGPILGGLGNNDMFYAPDFPNRPGYHGFSLRLLCCGSRKLGSARCLHPSQRGLPTGDQAPMHGDVL